MFCPKCGNKEVIDVFCKKCLKEEHPLLTGIKDISIDVCAVSSRVHYRNRWVPDDMQLTFRRIIQDSLQSASYATITEIEIPQIEVDLKPGLKIEEIIPITVIGKSSDNMKPYKEEYDVPITINLTISPPYNKMGTNYFEATLQVRNETPESKKLIEEVLAKHTASIAKQDTQPHGTDYYITSKSATNRALYALQEQFGGLVKTSAQLFSHNKQTSKDIYRVTDFIELPAYKPGDVLEGPKGPLLVVQLAKRIRFTNLQTGKTAYFEYKDAQFPKLTIHETRVSQDRPVLRVLHPETFEAQKVENPKDVGEIVSIVIYKNRIYLV